MNNITPEKIKEIAEELDMGFRAFIHKTTGELFFVPDEDNLAYADPEHWEEELKHLENNFNDYYEIYKWTSREAFQMRVEFAEQVSDQQLQSRLFDALQQKKPFQKFKFVIDNSGSFRKQWFDFKDKWQQDFVAKQLSRLIDK